MLGTLAENLEQRAGETIDAFQEDPIQESAKWMIGLGLSLSVVGGLGWLLGDYATKAALEADKDAGRRIAFIGQSFAAASAAGSVVGGAIAAWIAGLAPITTSVQTRLVPGRFETSNYYDTAGNDLGAPWINLTILDSTGKVVPGYDHVHVPLTANGTGTVYDWDSASGFISLQDGPTYAVVIGFGVPNGVVWGAYKTALLGTMGIRVGINNGIWDPATPLAQNALWVASGLTGLLITVPSDPTLNPSGTTEPTQSGGSSTTTNPFQTFGVVAGDLVGGIVGAAVGITEIPQAIWASVQVLPYLLWDGLIWGVGSAIGWLGTNFGPALLGFGVLLAAIGVALRWANTAVVPRVEVWVKTRQAPLLDQLDQALGIPKALPEARAVNREQAEVESAAATPPPAPAPPPTPPNPPPEAPNRELEPSGPLPPPPPEPFPVEPQEEEDEEEERPALPIVPTADVEALLGEPEAAEPTAAELREQERNRRATHPNPEPEAPSPMTDEQYWAALEQARGTA